MATTPTTPTTPTKSEGFFKGLPTWSKGVIAVGGTLLVGYIIYTIIKKVKREADLRTNLQESEAAEEELQQLENQGIEPTLSRTTVQAIISSLTDAMNGCGSDENRIYAQFNKLSNEADMQLLLKEFGVRYYRPCPADQPISYAQWMWNDKKFGGNLSQWLSYDLSTSELAKINSILQSKGIKYRL
jgi:hypothetical protein